MGDCDVPSNSTMEEVQLSEGLLRFKADGLMAFRVDEFKSLASRSGGFAVGNTFAVTLPSLGIANTRELNLLCKSTALPGLQITTIDKQMGTTVRKVANGRNHRPNQMNGKVVIYVDICLYIYLVACKHAMLC